MSIVRLKDNHRMSLSLRYTSAQEKPGKAGALEYLYTLENGNLIYVPPVAHAEIQSLHLGAGEPFWLSKVIGPGGAAVWSVERITEPKPKPVAAARSISAVPGIPLPPSLTTCESQRIFRQLVATIQAVKAAEEFSVSIGYPVKFGPEDIRAMGISGFIEQSRRAA